MTDDDTLGYNKAALYWAGKTFFPEAAVTTAQTDNAAYAQGPALQSEADWAGSPAALDVVMQLADLLQKSAKRTSQALERIGENLVTIADDFDRTDRGVEASYQRRLKFLETNYPATNPGATVPKTQDPYAYNPNLNQTGGTD